jgi:hypothetical protein
VLPQFWHGEPNRLLMAEALKIAAEAGLEFYHQGKARERNGVHLMMPRVYTTIESVNPVIEGSA